ALALLESLFPLAHSMRGSDPHTYYDYLNSLAVELCEVGRLEEAHNASRIVLASPFAPAYPEWRETSNEIALNRCRPPRDSVTGHQTVTEGPSSPATGDPATLLRLPVAERRDTLAPVQPFPPSRRARVLKIKDWKKRSPEAEKTVKSKEEKLSELQRLATGD